MQSNEIEILKRSVERERAARKQAERILESKSAELFQRTTELKVANDKLEQLVSRQTSELQGVFENIVDAYVVMDLEGNVLKMNNPAEELLEHSLVQEPLNLNSMVHPEDAEKVSHYFAVLVQDGSITDAEIRIKTVSGHIKLVHINASMIFDKADKPIGAQGIVRDITLARREHEKLMESESRLSKLIANLDSGVLLEDENRNIALTNQQFCDLFKIPAPPEALIGQNCENAAEQSKHLFKDPKSFVLSIDELLANRKTVLGEELVMDEGRILERDYIPIFIDEVYKGHLWTYRDITLKRKYRKSIDAQRQKYSGIIANMNLGLLEVDNDDVVQMVNQRFIEMSGYSEADLLGKKASDLLLDKNEKEKIWKKNSERSKGTADSYEIQVITGNGEQRYWLISGAPNYNINGELIGSIGIHLDITELKELELQKESLVKKLAKSNKELEEYAHVVSHDLKSPLRSLYALTSWLREENEGEFSKESLSYLELIEQTLEKMEKLISNVLLYSSVTSEDDKVSRVNLDEIVRQLISLIHVPDHIEVSIKKKLPKVIADETRMQQLFQNLLSNAIRYNDKEKGVVEIDYQIQKGMYQFCVRDNGIGIKEAYLDKIFGMFQRLDNDESSTGIGLSIVKRIIELYGGTIWVESEPTKGTTFYFTLPKP
ncbi:PAS domain S-box protein [Aureitalea sp. L0-47]|uniref:PAS domain-containing sensor histidine kinase n=1 Tax=Aureitalea sp. L0-47 TaxID=2816962 RepID=UPI002238CFF0|nr:PAS domain-containing sensor histidine kinase [Aureitalea sp. L0-47]MCW5518595.1 PAS domain S-box protein [Aureitalea sp. L0-47]